jgi:hypothetical protein
LVDFLGTKSWRSAPILPFPPLAKGVRRILKSTLLNYTTRNVSLRKMEENINHNGQLLHYHLLS